MESLWGMLARRSEARLAPRADQAARNLADQAVIASKNGGCSRNSKNRGAANVHERDPGVIASSPTAIQPDANVVQKMQRVCATRWTLQSIASTGNASSRLRIVDRCHLGRPPGR